MVYHLLTKMKKIIFDDTAKANELNCYFASNSYLHDIEANNLSNLNDADI